MTAQTSAPSERRGVIYTLTALAVLVLTVIPVGTAVFFLGFVRGDSPCVMCWEQRIGMILISLVGLFVLRYGPRPKYVGMAVLIAMWGVFMGLRHVGMHAARDIGQGFALEIMGAHTYTWAVFIYYVCALAMGLLLLLTKSEDLSGGVRALGPLENITFAAFIVVVAGNVVQAFASTGPPPYMGQSDPIRFSFNPKHWHWSTEEWKPPIKYSLRGRWAVEKPSVEQAADFAAVPENPLGALTALAVKERRPVALAFNAAPTDLAFDPASSQFLVTTDVGIYLTDATLSKINRYTLIDVGYSVDLGRFAGAAFLDKNELIAVGENKSFVVLTPSDTAKADENFRYFLESADKFDETNRSRFTTVRARLLYTMSAAYDADTKSILTLTVPNHLVKRLIISRFDRKDYTLSEEYSPSIAKASGLTLGDKRSLGEFYVTGAAVKDGILYAISAAYSTLLAIDLTSHQLLAAYTVPDLKRPIGLAATADDLFILGDDRTVTILARPLLPAPGEATTQPVKPGASAR